VPSVLQEWVQDLSFMQQATLLTAVRGCDGLAKYHVSKFLVRWLRRCILISAFKKKVLENPWEDDGGNFTGKLPQDRFKSVPDLFKQYLANIDDVPHHFHMHIVHAAEILGYMHPDPEIRASWEQFYYDCCRDLHMNPESKTQLLIRLGDSKKQWLELGREEIV
jgi:hypothetical protein